MVQQRLTISLDEPLAAAIDAFAAGRGYASRSEAMRDLLREALLARVAEPPGAGGHAVAAVSYVVDHRRRDLAARLAEARHGQHDVAVATLQAPLDHRHALEVVLLRGPARAVRALADATTRERGVRFGQVNLVPLAAGEGRAHRHGPDGRVHLHREPVP